MFTPSVILLFLRILLHLLANMLLLFLLFPILPKIYAYFFEKILPILF